MTDDELLRYSRHILLPEVGVQGQERLLSSRALVIGAGGLGSPVALYLAGGGVGHITLVDHDTVDVTNLQRQIAHGQDSVGQPKVASARQRMLQMNPLARIECLQEKADAPRLHELVRRADVVLDCSDNFTTRQAVNAACVAHGVPLVSGAAIGWDGQISVYDTRLPENPCYACVFPPDTTFEEVRCATMGVFAPLVGIIGSLQAAEALKLLAGTGSSLAGRLCMLDLRTAQWDEVRLARQAHCPVCSARIAPG
ncbi:MAG: molybdopterin-synthase adenylyltransferase MoeB [Burkholderiales bacterium]|nr:molybdopterin-synthase adenylyltransferase MoeB [Burkholderiales bacterium]